MQDKTAMPDKFSIGEEVKVQFNLKGTKWEKDGRTNFITNLDAWRMESLKLSQNSGGGQETNYNDIPPSDDENDLPF